MKDKLINICFLFPFVFTVLNLQVFVAFLISDTLAQIIAYLNLGLLIMGVGLIIKNRGELSKTSRLWIFFYLLYFAIAVVSGIIHYNDASIIASTIPFFYVVGFYYYLSLDKNIALFEKTAMIAFTISCLVCIYFDMINFDLDKGGVALYPVDRAQGLYGDANNMALMTIITFIFVFKAFKPAKKIFKIIKITLLGLIFYSLFLTFSTTGFTVFFISILVLNQKFFTGIKAVIGIVLLPVVYILLLNLNNLTADMNLVGQQRDKINNLVNVLSFNFDKVDDSGRSDLVSHILHYIFENPFLGNGIDFGAAHKAHNTFIGIWADAGIFVLLFFLFMLATYFVRALRSSKDIMYFVILMLLTLCIFMLSLHSVINQPYLMGLFIYLGYLVDDKQRKTIYIRKKNFQ